MTRSVWTWTRLCPCCGHDLVGTPSMPMCPTTGQGLIRKNDEDDAGLVPVGPALSPITDTEGSAR